MTCGHNIVCDVSNAGGEVVLDGDHTVDTYVDGSLITGRHPGVVDEFMEQYLAELLRRRPPAA